MSDLRSLIPASYRAAARSATKIALLCATFLVTFAGDDDYVRFTLEPPAASPYHTIRYEITRRTPATTAVHRRLLPGQTESLHALGLLTDVEADTFFALARSVDATHLPSAAHPTPGLLTWRCDLQLDGVAHTFLTTDPANAKDRRYFRLFHAVRELALTLAGPLPFRNVFYPAAQRGWLNIETVPTASVRVDDFETHMETPLYSYEVPAGSHTLTLRSRDGRIERTIDVRVEPEGTTTLRIDLR